MRKKSKINLLPFGIILAMSVLFITIFSKNSFLYWFNNGPDISVIFEVGRRMFNGSVLYRDVVDHKGPFLYVIYGLASLISSKSYIGVYFFEIVSAFLTLSIAFKAFKLKFDTKLSVFGAFIIATVFYCSPLNTFGGDTVELMLMPAFIYLYYLGFRYVYSKQEIKKYEYFLIGITSGCVLWSKYTLIGIYLAWIIIPAIDLIKEKKIKALASNLLVIACGVAISTIPWIIYFGVNNYLAEFFNFYFLEQASGYVFKISFIKRNSYAYYLIVVKMLPFTIVGICYLLKKIIIEKKINKKMLLYNLLMFAFIYIFCFIIGNGSIIFYYLIQMFVLYIPIVYILLDIVKKSAKKSVLIALLAVAFSLFAVVNSSTIQYINEKKEETPYYIFAQDIEKADIKNPVIYGNTVDITPFYKYMDNFIDYKYFSVLNIVFPEQKDFYFKSLQNGDFDFFIAMNEEKKISERFDYTLLDSVEYYYEGDVKTFNLYESNRLIEGKK